MPNNVTFFIPAPKLTPSGATSKKQTTKYQAIRFKKKGNPVNFFKSQFTVASPANAPLALHSTMLALTQAALNAGYGNANYERLDVSQTEWDALGNYLRQRLATVLFLMHSTSLPLKRAGIFRLLDRTEKLPMSNLLGSIFCRIATDVWANVIHKKSPVLHFWHWKIYRDQAVDLTGSERAKMDKVENPDFLFKTSQGWYTAEAKGSFSDGENWTELKWGLQQAAKFEQIDIFNISSAASTQHPIEGFNCTMTYFDSAEELQVTHLDPPLAKKQRIVAATIITEFACLVRFEEALKQFELLSQPSDSLPEWVDDLTSVHWQLMHGEAGSADAVYLGKPNFMHAIQKQVALALKILRAVVPLVGKRASFPRQTAENTSPPVDADLKALRQTWIVQARTSLSQAERSFWISLVRELDLRTDKMNSDYFWKNLLKQIASKELFKHPEGSGKISILGLSDHVTKRIAAAALYAKLNANLKQQNNTVDTRVHVFSTDNGLLLATGKWLAGDPKKALPRLKI